MIRSSTVLNGTFSSDDPGSSMMKTASSRIPMARAAFSAVPSSGRHVMSAVALDDRSWCSNSDTEYMAFAGVTMPLRRWTANVDII